MAQEVASEVDGAPAHDERGASTSPPWREHLIALAVLLMFTALAVVPLFRGRTLLDDYAYQSVTQPWAAFSGPAAGLEDPPDGVLHWDGAKSFYPWQVLVAEGYRDGEVSWWNPFNLGGLPFFANATTGAAYPPRVVLSLVLPAHRVHDGLVVTHLAAGGLCMYALLRRWRLALLPALLGSVSWLLNSFVVAWAALDHLLVIHWTLPATLWAIDRHAERRSPASGALVAALMALMYLGGNALFVLVTWVVLAGYAAWLLGRENLGRGRWPGPRSAVLRAGGMAWPLAAAVGLAAPALLPNLHLIGETSRSTVPYHDLVTTWKAPLDVLGRMFWPAAPDVTAGFQHDHYHAALFVGTPTAMLALVGLFSKHRAARFALVGGAVTLLLAFGTPVARLAYLLIPGFDNFKPLGRLFYVVDLALCILAAFGAAALLATLSARRPALRTAGAVAVAVLVAVSGVQLAWLASRLMRDQPADAAYRFPATPLVDSLAGATRVLPEAGQLPGSTTILYGIHSVGGYESLTPRRVSNLARVINGEPATEVDAARKPVAFETSYSLETLRYDLLARLAVTDLATLPDSSLPASAGGFVSPDPVYAGVDGRHYRVLDPLPLVHLVAGCELVAEPDDALARFGEPGFPFRDRVVLEAADGGAPCASGPDGPAGTATVTRRGRSSVRIDVRADRAGWLVLNETWDEGWSAEVDGRAVSVRPGNYASRAVAITPGSHEVVFRYRPPALSRGLGLAAGTTTALAVAVGLSVLRRRRRRPRRSRPQGDAGEPVVP